jgi:hypothetical protein
MRRLLNDTSRREQIAPKDSVALPPSIIGTAHPQTQSDLLNLVPKDVRLLIYEAVLAEPYRLLHIISYCGKEIRELGHWHCVDQDSPLPTWQHKCFGIWSLESRVVHRFEPRSNSNFLSLLVTYVYSAVHYS